MAKPIALTPTLYGDDARRVLDSLKNVASADVIARRRVAARKFAEEVSAPYAASTSPPWGGGARSGHVCIIHPPFSAMQNTHTPTPLFLLLSTIILRIALFSPRAVQL